METAAAADERWAVEREGDAAWRAGELHTSHEMEDQALARLADRYDALRRQEERERTEDGEDGEEDEDDWMEAHLAALGSESRQSAAMGEVEASVRAALSILNQSSDGQEDEEDEEDPEEELKQDWTRADAQQPHYFDFVQEAMEARWSLNSPSRNLLSSAEAAANEDESGEDQEEEEREDDEQSEHEHHQESTTVAESTSERPEAEGETATKTEETTNTEQEADNQVELADDEWQEAYTAKGRVYYYNRRTRESSWNRPPKFRASSRPRSPDNGSATPHRAVSSQSLGYHSLSSASPGSIADQHHLFCCFCGSRQDPDRFQDHFQECKTLTYHKNQSTSLYRGFQRMLTILSEDSSLRSMHYASSFPDATPVPLSDKLQDNLTLLRRRPSTPSPEKVLGPDKVKARRSVSANGSQGVRGKDSPERYSPERQRQQPKKLRPARNGTISHGSPSVRSKIANSFPVEVEKCRYCGRSFAEGRLAKHESVCPRVFGNEGSWGRGSPTITTHTNGTGAGQPTTSPASKQRRSLTQRKMKTNKSLTDAHTLEASYKEHQAALVLCPCCKRKFAPSGAQQHIAICKSVQNRPKNPISLLKEFATAG